MPAASLESNEPVAPPVQPFRLSPVANVHLAFGSVAVLLILLILLTPTLETGGLNGGTTFLDQGEVLVDLNDTGAWTFTVSSYGNVLFASIDVGVNTTVTSPVPGNATQERTWNLWHNASDVAELTTTVTGHPYVEVNVSETYVSPSTPTSASETTVSYGVYAFDLVNTTAGLTVVVTPVYPIVGSITIPASNEGGSTWPVITLPQSVALAQGPSAPTTGTAISRGSP